MASRHVRKSRSKKKKSKSNTKSVLKKCKVYFMKEMKKNIIKYKNGQLVSKEDVLKETAKIVIKKYPSCKNNIQTTINLLRDKLI